MSRGSLLIFVVWTISLLSILIAGMAGQSQFALSLTQRMEQRLNGSYLAMAGLERAVKVLSEDLTIAFDGFGDDWANNPLAFDRQPVGEGVFTIGSELPDGSAPGTYGLMDEERKINLNTAPHTVLQTLMERVGRVREHDAEAMADAIEDWRDEDTETKPHGAENFYYQGLQDAYESKDGPFENIEELLLIRGMTPEVYARLVPVITVYGSGQVNVNTAPRGAWQALGLSDSAINGILQQRAGDDKQEGTMDDRAITSTLAIEGELASTVSIQERHRIAQLVEQNVLTVRSEAFRASITATAHGATYPVHVECVISRDGAVKLWAEQ